MTETTGSESLWIFLWRLAEECGVKGNENVSALPLVYFTDFTIQSPFSTCLKKCLCIVFCDGFYACMYTCVCCAYIYVLACTHKNVYIFMHTANLLFFFYFFINIFP
uniref:Uncharacterized protein n=1 Tax=Anguilla anguilla TaxID=7936 RepID=A0A0E9X9Q7_ANGAN